MDTENQIGTVGWDSLYIFVSSEQCEHSSDSRTINDDFFSLLRNTDAKFFTDSNRLVLSPMGLWPDVENIETDKNSKLKSIISLLVILGFLFLPQSTLLLMSFDDSNLLVQILATGEIVFSCALIKIIILRINREALGKLLKYIEEDWIDCANEEMKEIMLKNAKFVRTLCISSLVVSYLTFLFLIIAKIYLHFTMTSEANTYLGLQLFFPSYVPKYFLESPTTFEIIFFSQMVTTAIVINVYMGSDNFLVLLIMHVSTQSTILRLSLGNLPLKVNPEDSIKFKRELGIIVRRHDHLNRFASMIDETFNISLLLQMILCSALLCFQCFQVLMKVKVKNAEISDMELVFLLFFVSVVLVQLYIYCYFGEILQQENEAIRSTAYECLWYIYSSKDARNMILIMARTVRPMKLTAGKFSSITMSTFADILKTSMSYLSVILATIKEPTDS